MESPPVASGARTKETRPAHGIGYMVAAISVYSAGDVVLKELVADFPVAQILCLRSLGAVALILAYAALRRNRDPFKIERPWGQALRAAFLLAAIVLYVLSLRHLPLAETVTLFFAAPFFLTALSIPLLGEKVGWRRWTAVGVGFAGVLVVMRPGSGAFNPAALLAVGSALCYSLVNITTRWLGRTETTLSMVAFQNAALVVLPGALAPFVWVAPTAVEAAVMVALGAIFVVAPLAHVTALKLAPVNLMAPFEYVAIVWAVLFGWLFWGELPGAQTWLGIAIIVGSGLYVLYRELKQAAEKPVATPHPSTRRP